MTDRTARRLAYGQSGSALAVPGNAERLLGYGVIDKAEVGQSQKMSAKKNSYIAQAPTQKQKQKQKQRKEPSRRSAVPGTARTRGGQTLHCCRCSAVDVSTTRSLAYGQSGSALASPGNAERLLGYGVSDRDEVGQSQKMSAKMNSYIAQAPTQKQKQRKEPSRLEPLASLRAVRASRAERRGSYAATAAAQRSRVRRELEPSRRSAIPGEARTRDEQTIGVPGYGENESRADARRSRVRRERETNRRSAIPRGMGSPAQALFRSRKAQEKTMTKTTNNAQGIRA